MSSKENSQLIAEIDQLRKEVNIKDNENSSLVSEIEDLKDTLKIFEEAQAEFGEGEAISGDKKLQIELEIRDKELRELKNKMGVLRKEKIQIQQQLEQEVKKTGKRVSAPIVGGEGSDALQSLVKDLQGKLNKQRLVITRLKQENIEKTSLVEVEVRKRIKGDQDREIIDLTSNAETNKKELIELKNLLETKSAELEKLKAKKKSSKGKKKEPEIEAKKPEVEVKAPEASAQATGTMNVLVKDLQEKLNKARTTVNRLKGELKKSREAPIEEAGESLQEQVFKLQTDLEFREKSLAELKSKNQVLEEKIKTVDTSSYDKLLSDKNKKIESLSKQIGEDKSQTTEFETQLNERTQKLEALQKSYDEMIKKNNTLTKDYENLQAQLSEKEASIEASGGAPQQTLRVRELRSMLESFKKQIRQQRVEITTLRKN